MLDKFIPAIVVLVAGLAVFAGLWIASRIKQTKEHDNEDNDSGSGGCLGGK